MPTPPSWRATDGKTIPAAIPISLRANSSYSFTLVKHQMPIFDAWLTIPGTLSVNGIPVTKQQRLTDGTQLFVVDGLLFSHEEDVRQAFSRLLEEKARDGSSLCPFGPCQPQVAPVQPVIPENWGGDVWAPWLGVGLASKMDDWAG